MKNKLFHKLFLTTAVALVVSVLLILVLISVSVKNYLITDKKQLLTDNCKTVASVLTSRTDSNINFQAGLDAMISVVSMVRRGSVIVSFMMGAFLFHEKNLKSKAVDLVLVLLGMLFLYLGTICN